MAAKSKKRLSKIENKLLKLDKLQINDVICSICQSILIEPVTLPCFHDFCKNCFNGSIENNALCCPLCRLRIGSWLRTNTKRRNLVNVDLWKHIQNTFAKDIDKRAKGEDVIEEAVPIHRRLSAPGEIRKEYETELKRLREERQQLEEKHIEETELLIKKIQQEEEEAHKKYLEALKRDEMIAKQMQKELKHTTPPNIQRRHSLRSCTKPRLKNTTIDDYLSKLKPPQSPLLTDDNTNSTNSSTPKLINKPTNGANSPEMVPSYGKIIKNLFEKKKKLTPGLWNKENGDKVKDNKEDSEVIQKQPPTEIEEKSKIKKKTNIPSLLVSLPLPHSSILQQKSILSENRKEIGSDDSMRQELCYFKPIEEITTPRNSNKVLPYRVPVVRATPGAAKSYESQPTRSQYLESLCQLRNLSLANNSPSAFVIALNSLKVKRNQLSKCETNRSKVKKRLSTSPSPAALPTKKPNNKKQLLQIKNVSSINKTNLRRTRSMGSITKDENETTPKKAKLKERKAVSDRKPYLRSDSKKTKTKSESPPKYTESLNNNKVNLVVKNLSSPLKNCDVKQILHEQLRIEKIIEQENSDFELARKLEAEWNGRRPRREAVKRKVNLNYELRPAKKLKA